MLEQGTIVLAAAKGVDGLGALSPIEEYNEYSIQFGDMFIFDNYSSQLIVLTNVLMEELGDILYAKFISPTYTQPT